MSGRGLQYTFHGAFNKRSAAREKAAEVGGGAFVKRIKIHGHERFAVVSGASSGSGHRVKVKG